MSNFPPQQPPPGSGGQQPPQPPPPPGGYQPQYGSQYGPPPSQQPVGPGGQRLAEWWKRLVAVLLDGFIVGVPLGILRAIITAGDEAEIDPFTGEAEGEGFLAGVGLVLFLLSIVVPILYQGLLNGSPRGQTIGKMALRIQVRDANAGGPIGTGRGLLRAAVYQLLFLACLIPGFVNGLSPLWDQRRQAWHDKVTGSVVVDAP